ncbi:sel1 repeat family protein [Myxococcota bacterium]|nr:sel1 repeat family protein [Myxococcota bacterium]
MFTLVTGCDRLGYLYGANNSMIIAGERVNDSPLIAFLNSQKGLKTRERLVIDCARGKGLSCFMAGKHFGGGVNGTSVDLKKAYRHYRLACQNGTKEGCIMREFMKFTGKGVDINRKSALRGLELYCDEKVEMGCERLGSAYLRKGPYQDHKKAMKYLQKSCTMGYIHGCAVLGRLYLMDTATAQKKLRYVGWLKKSCDQGYSVSCNYLGVMSMDGNGMPQSYSRALMFFKHACNQGSDYGCLNLSYFFRNGIFVKKDNRKSYALVEKSCEMHNPESCTYAAWHKTLHLGVNGKSAEGLKELREICSSFKFGLGCTMLGYVYRFGAGVEKNRSKAVSLYRRGCTYHDSEGCAALGSAFLEGMGVSQDISSALVYYKRACSMHNRDACAEEAFIMARTGGGQWKRKARHRLEKLCLKYNGLGCAYLAYMYEAGWGAAKNGNSAYRLYVKSCNLREGKACYRLGRLYEMGTIVPVDVRTAMNYYVRSCDLHHSKACVALGDFLQARSQIGAAKEAYKFACFREDKVGCYKLGILFEDGTGLEYNPKGAKAAYNIACQEGHSKSCQRLKRLKAVLESEQVRSY